MIYTDTDRTVLSLHWCVCMPILYVYIVYFASDNDFIKELYYHYHYYYMSPKEQIKTKTIYLSFVRKMTKSHSEPPFGD